MPKIGNFELPEPDKVKTACDVCHVLNGVGTKTRVPLRHGSYEERTRSQECRAITQEVRLCRIIEGNITTCTDATRAQILLAYFNLIKQ